jgi:hypothetical protein
LNNFHEIPDKTQNAMEVACGSLNKYFYCVLPNQITRACARAKIEVENSPWAQYKFTAHSDTGPKMPRITKSVTRGCGRDRAPKRSARRSRGKITAIPVLTKEM